jgi:hypothetical protein
MPVPSSTPAVSLEHIDLPLADLATPGLWYVLGRGCRRSLSVALSLWASVAMRPGRHSA